MHISRLPLTAGDGAIGWAPRPLMPPSGYRRNPPVGEDSESTRSDAILNSTNQPQKNELLGYFYAHACRCQARVAGQEKLPSLVSSLDRIPSRSASRRCAPLEPCSNHGDLNMSTDATMREHAEHVHLPSPHRPHALSCTHAHRLLTCCSFVMNRSAALT